MEIHLPPGHSHKHSMAAGRTDDDNTRPSFGGNIFSAVAATPPTPIAFIHRRRGALPIRMQRELPRSQIGGEFSQLTNFHDHGCRTELDL